MPYNGSGVYSLPGAVLADGLDILATEHNTLRNDMAAAFNLALTRDGQAAATANIPMGGFKLTNVASATARTDSINAGQVQDGVINWVAAGGTADAITAAYAPALTALVDGQYCFVRAGAANATTTPTFAPNGLTAHTITKYGGSALVAGDIAGAGHEIILRYNLAGARWELLNPNPAASSGDMLLAGVQTVTGAKTFNDAKMLLRNVANTFSGYFTNAITAARTWTLPDATGTVPILELLQTWTKSQRGTVTVANTASYDMSLTNNFITTLAAGQTITFTNIAAGQSGLITLVNGANYAVSKAASVKCGVNDLTTLSTSGTYLISYYSPDGTTVYLGVSGAQA